MEHITVDFAEALKQFKSMFPHLSQDTIENVLRRHSGNVGLAVDELLSIAESSALESSSAQMDSFYLEPPPPYEKVVQPSALKQKQQTSSGLNSTRSSVDMKNETVDDEKLALMLQNEEFLRYLRGNAAFMREIYGHDYNREVVPYRRSFQAYHPGMRYSRRTYSNGPVTPNGPLVETASSSIPNGPHVDYNYNDSSVWTKRIKSKLPGSRQSEYTLSDPCPSGPGVSTGALESYYSPNDFQSRLKAMSKTSKIMFVELAKKFSFKKELKLLPSIEDPTHR
uniref:CUE domain-containing protein n=1 Tax=Panagrolaimus sp. JU765 TaxID=591449 RepID=A0AC34RJI9_9BILA